MGGGALMGRVRRLLPRWLDRAPAKPPAGEVASASIAGRLQPYIGELPAHPRQASRYAHSWSDDNLALRIYRDILRDERCQAALDQRLDAAISRPWEVEPGGNNDEDKAAAEDLKTQLDTIRFNGACRQLLHGVWYGYAIAEAIWSRDESRVVLADLVVRAPDRFRWSPEGEPLLRTETDPYGAAIPPGKFVVLARPGEHGDLPHGRGLARWCFWPTWFKRHSLQFWSVALEKFGAPSVVGKYPPGATEEQKAELLELVQAYATSLGITLAEGQSIEIIESERRAGGDFQAFTEYMDRMITTTILGQSSTTDQGPWRGTAEVQKDVRDETVAADCRLLDNALNATVARWLTQWNHPGAAIPRIHRDASPPEDLNARATREEVIARTAGLRPTKAHVEQVYGGEWEEAPAPPPPQALPPAEDEEATLAALAGGRSGDTISGAVDRLVRDEWEPMMEPVIQPLLEAAGTAMRSGESLEAFQGRLPTLMADMDASRLTETLRRMGFSARLSGDAGLDEGPDGPASQ